MATVPVTLHTAAFIDEADGAYTLGGRAAYRMLVNISDANQTTTDAAKGAALTLTGINAVSWDRVNGLDGSTISLASPPTGMTLEIGPVTPDNMVSGLRYIAINTTPPGADHPTRWVGWATLGTVFTGTSVPAGGDVPAGYTLPGTGLAVGVYTNLSLAGTAVRQDVRNLQASGAYVISAELLPSWHTNDQNISVLARGTLKIATTGAYRFVFDSDDGCRLYINGVPIIDDWVNSAGRRMSGLQDFTAGQIVNIRAENFSPNTLSNRYSFLLQWEINGAPAVPIPTSVMYPIGWESPVPVAPRPVQASYGVDYVQRYF